VEHNFTPKYRVPNEKKEVVKELASLADRADRSISHRPRSRREAIAWHLMEAAGSIGRGPSAWCSTNHAGRDRRGVAQPRDIDMQLSMRRQARRILDFARWATGTQSALVAQIRGRLSAGRVQSVALR